MKPKIMSFVKYYFYYHLWLLFNWPRLWSSVDHARSHSPVVKLLRFME